MFEKRPKRNWEALKIPAVLKSFGQELLHGHEDETAEGLDQKWDAVRTTIQDAVEKHIPTVKACKRKPWISQDTLELICQRNDARKAVDRENEQILRKMIQKSARKDRAAWLNNLAGKGDWQSLKKLRKSKQVSQTRLLDAQGQVVSTEFRAETLAEYLEKVQWCVRPIALQPDPPPPFNENVQVSEELFSHKELRKSIFSLKSGKSVRENDAPIECFKAAAQSGGPVLQNFLDLCNTCWAHGEVPMDWLTSRVSMIFKKGDPALCGNYRPICLTAVAYRIYACMVKQRLLEAGIDKLLWGSQFGFRSARSTQDAMFCARRHIEFACARRCGQVSLLALDWAKAFDSVHVGRLLQCLARFGIKGPALKAIAGLMNHRKFFVEDCGSKSQLRPQRSGISQGCTLSPLLFVIVMSAVMRAAVGMLSAEARTAYDQGDLADIVYADDTLLLGTRARHMEEFLRAVALAGKNYGLELHEGKFQLLQVQCSYTVRNASGTRIESASNLAYLGATLAADGYASSELSRRIGAAKADFRSLCQVWKHAALPRSRKLEIYRSLIESKLLYGLCTASYRKADLRRLDGFQSKCLRTILGILPAHLSRVSNGAVRSQVAWKSASTLLLEVLRLEDASPLRTCCFVAGTLEPRTCHYIRKVGRPRKEWLTDVLPQARRAAGGAHLLQAAVQNKLQWKRCVKQFTFSSLNQ